MFSLPASRRLFGFWPKLLVFKAAVAQRLYVALAVAGILGTVVGAYYYLKIVKVMYFDAPMSKNSPRRNPSSRGTPTVHPAASSSTSAFPGSMGSTCSS
jgi:NADH-quinone oxidoreductase subunit N